MMWCGSKMRRGWGGGSSWVLALVRLAHFRLLSGLRSSRDARAWPRSAPLMPSTHAQTPCFALHEMVLPPPLDSSLSKQRSTTQRKATHRKQRIATPAPVPRVGCRPCVHRTLTLESERGSAGGEEAEHPEGRAPWYGLLAMPISVLQRHARRLREALFSRWCSSCRAGRALVERSWKRGRLSARCRSRGPRARPRAMVRGGRDGH